MKKTIFFATLLVTQVILAACRPATQSVSVDFNDLVNNPSGYDGRQVCTSGVFLTGFEVSALGADTYERDGLTYLTEPVLWIEGGEFTNRIDCIMVGEQGVAFEFCRVTICGVFDYCHGCGHLNRYQFQLTGNPLPVVATTTSVGAEPVPAATLRPEPTRTHIKVPTRQPTPTNTPIPIPTLNIQVSDQTGLFYELVFSIPLGENGVRYQGLGVDEMEVTGPNALAVLPDGRFVIADHLDNRLLYYNASGRLLKTIDLLVQGIVNVSDLRVAANQLFLTEISFYVAPTRYRINRLTLEGELIAFYDIPNEYRLADNLPGITIDGDGRLLLNVEGMALPSEYNLKLPGKVTQLVDVQGIWSPVATDGLAYFGKIFRFDLPATISKDNRPAVIAGDIRVETALTLGMGSLQLLGALPDGRFYLIREDVVSDSPTFEVDLTVHLIKPDGVQLGVGRYPLTERLYHVERSMSLGPDGYIYALLPREKTLDVIRLFFFTRLAPLVPGSAEPWVSKD